MDPTFLMSKGAQSTLDLEINKQLSINKQRPRLTTRDKENYF